MISWTADLAKAIGDQVRWLRLEAGMSQVEVADAVGVHPPVISRIERGTRVPSLETLSRVTRAIGYTPADVMLVVDELLGNEGAGRYEINHQAADRRRRPQRVVPVPEGRRRRNGAPCARACDRR